MQRSFQGSSLTVECIPQWDVPYFNSWNTEDKSWVNYAYHESYWDKCSSVFWFHGPTCTPSSHFCHGTVVQSRSSWWGRASDQIGPENGRISSWTTIIWDAACQCGPWMQLWDFDHHCIDSNREYLLQAQRETSTSWSEEGHFFQPEGDHLTLLVVYEAWKSNNFSGPWCFENLVRYRSLGRA